MLLLPLISLSRLELRIFLTLVSPLFLFCAVAIQFSPTILLISLMWLVSLYVFFLLMVSILLLFHRLYLSVVRAESHIIYVIFMSISFVLCLIYFLRVLPPVDPSFVLFVVCVTGRSLACGILFASDFANAALPNRRLLSISLLLFRFPVYGFSTFSICFAFNFMYICCA